MRKGTEKDWLGSEFTRKNCKKHEKTRLCSLFAITSESENNMVNLNRKLFKSLSPPMQTHDLSVTLLVGRTQIHR